MDFVFRNIEAASLNSAKQKFLATGKISQYDFDILTSVDPTASKKYLEWLCWIQLKDEAAGEEGICDWIKRYNNEKGAENRRVVMSMLSHYDDVLRVNSKTPNIMSFSTWKSFESYMDFEIHRPRLENEYRRCFAKATKGVDYKFSGKFTTVAGDICEVYEILTFKGSRSLGDGRPWCIVASQDHYNSYREDNDHFFFIIFHPDSNIYRSLHYIASGPLVKYALLFTNDEEDSFLVDMDNDTVIDTKGKYASSDIDYFSRFKGSKSFFDKLFHDIQEPSDDMDFLVPKGQDQASMDSFMRAFCYGRRLPFFLKKPYVDGIVLGAKQTGSGKYSVTLGFDFEQSFVTKKGGKPCIGGHHDSDLIEGLYLYGDHFGKKTFLDLASTNSADPLCVDFIDISGSAYYAARGLTEEVLVENGALLSSVVDMSNNSGSNTFFCFRNTKIYSSVIHYPERDYVVSDGDNHYYESVGEMKASNSSFSYLCFSPFDSSYKNCKFHNCLLFFRVSNQTIQDIERTVDNSCSFSGFFTFSVFYYSSLVFSLYFKGAFKIGRLIEFLKEYEIGIDTVCVNLRTFGGKYPSSYYYDKWIAAGLPDDEAMDEYFKGSLIKVGFVNG